MTDKNQPRKATNRSLMAKPPSQEGKKRSFAPPGGAGSGKSNATAALARDTASVTTDSVSMDTNTTSMTEVPAWKVRTWKYKDRSADSLIDDPDFDELKEEIAEIGVLEPLLVIQLPSPDEHGREFEQIAGFKRLTASMQINPNMMIPVRIVAPEDTLAALRIQRGENKGRSDPPFWDQARVLVLVMKDEGISNRTELAHRVGYKRELCSELVRIGGCMPEDYVKSIRLNRLSRHALRALVQSVEGLSGKTYQEMVDRIVEAADEISEKPDRATKLVERITSDVLAGDKKSQNDTATKAAYRSQKGRTLSTRSDSNKAVFTLHRGALEVISAEELEESITELLRAKGLTLEKES